MGVAQFGQIQENNGVVNWWNVAGIVAAVLVAAGGIIVLVVDADASKELATAHEAAEQSRQLQDDLAKLDTFVGYAENSIYLSQSYSVMRGSVEQSLADPTLTPESAIEAMLEVSMRQLEAAANFEPGSDWTICIYKAVVVSTGNELRLIADRRAVACPRSEARSWPLGVGPAGVALANRAEVILDDLMSPALGTTYRLPPNLRRDHDKLRYRAIAAVPILVGKDHHPWGVALGSMNRVGHFASERFQTRSVSTDTIRAVAEMCALAVAVRHVPAAAAAPPSSAISPRNRSKMERNDK